MLAVLGKGIVDMCLHVFLGNKEVKFERQIEPHNEPSAFESGFDSAARLGEESSCPFPPYSTAEKDWLRGRKLFQLRKQRYRWFVWDKDGLPGESTNKSFTHLCLVVDTAGLYRHMPCQFTWMGLEGGIWTPYSGHQKTEVIEWTYVEKPNPMHGLARKQRNAWFDGSLIDAEFLNYA
ncbi:hypothetical protein [Salinisphaera sp. C84B14]|uniref:hypothetical protein n=1 Tax=Salinisphaera sp. C84B14 TaxID=1304155 RepID=UPI0033429414